MHQVFDGCECPAFGGLHHANPLMIPPAPIEAGPYPG
jgi:hypothetical protein